MFRELCLLSIVGTMFVTIYEQSRIASHNIFLAFLHDAASVNIFIWKLRDQTNHDIEMKIYYSRGGALYVPNKPKTCQIRVDRKNPDGYLQRFPK